MIRRLSLYIVLSSVIEVSASCCQHIYDYSQQVTYLQEARAYIPLISNTCVLTRKGRGLLNPLPPPWTPLPEVRRKL